MPISSHIPLLMVILFLLFTLGAAYRFTKSSASFRDYAVGDKQFSTGYLVVTLLSTFYGGGTLVCNIELIHQYGFYCLLLILFASFLIFWIISLLALRMAPFMQHLSMSETIGYVYGTYPRMIASLAYIVSAIPCILIQIRCMTLAIGICVDTVNPHLLTTMAIVIFVLYATIGGIRAVMVTGVVQLFTLCTALPSFAWLVFTKTNKPLGELFSLVQAQEQFQLRCLFHTNMHVRHLIGLLLPYLVAGITPPIMQKVYMAEDHFQASSVFLKSSVSNVCLLFFILIIGLFTFVIEPNLSGIDTCYVILANSPVLLKGFMAMGILALAMSTADSFLNSCSVILSHDIVETIIGPKVVPYKQQLRLAKCIACFVGTVVILFSYCNYNVMVLLESYFDYFVPIATAPFILAVLGFQSSSYTALMGMATGTLAILSWNLWIKPITNMNGSFFCMLANGLAMLIAYYWLGNTKHKE